MNIYCSASWLWCNVTSFLKILLLQLIDHNDLYPSFMKHDNKENKKPISLRSIDTKILSKIFGHWIQDILLDQMSFIQGM